MPSCYTSLILLGRFLRLKSFSLQCSELTIWSLKLVSKQQMNYFWKIYSTHCAREELMYSRRGWTFTFFLILRLSLTVLRMAIILQLVQGKLFCQLIWTTVLVNIPGTLFQASSTPICYRPSHEEKVSILFFPLFISRETVKGQQSISHWMEKQKRMGNLRLMHYFESAQLVVW